MYQVFYKVEESRNAPGHGPLSFATKEERKAFTEGRNVFWYHFAEEDDWHQWSRGGAWAATAKPGREDVVPEPPPITEEDRW
jgi:hypothetical protein